jgi:hypothetical protein
LIVDLKTAKALGLTVPRRRGNRTTAVAKRWSHFLAQPSKVDLPMQRTTHHEDAETVFG